MQTITLSREELFELQEKYVAAFEAGVEQISYKGADFYVPYLKYFLEYAFAKAGIGKIKKYN